MERDLLLPPASAYDGGALTPRAPRHVRFRRLALLAVFVLLHACGTDGPEEQEELTTEHNESDDAHNSKLISKPKAIYNYLKSHHDDGLVFESKNGNFRVRARTRVQLQFSVTDNDSNSTDTDFFLRRLRLKLDCHAFRPWLRYVLQVSRDDIKGA